MQKIVNGKILELTLKEELQRIQEEKDATIEQDQQEKQAKIQTIEQEMKELRANRDWLQELIDMWIDATGDTEKLEAIKTEMYNLALQRKELL